MVKSFKETHAKDLEKLAADRQRESQKKVRDDVVNTPKHTVLSVVGLTSPEWTLGMFQMVTGESWQCIPRTKQTGPCHVGVRHVACTVPKLYEAILKLVKQMQAWGDTRIKKIMKVLAVKGIQISIAAAIWYSYVFVSLQNKRLDATCCSRWQHVLVSHMQPSCFHCRQKGSLRHALVWLVWFVSKRFVNEIIMIIIKHVKSLIMIILFWQFVKVIWVDPCDLWNVDFLSRSSEHRRYRPTETR